MESGGPLRIAQEIEVMPPKPGRAFPMPVDEYQRLIQWVKRLPIPSSSFLTAAWALLGVGAAEAATILTGSVDSRPIHLVVAWTITLSALSSAAVCFIANGCLNKSRSQQGIDLAVQMELIQKRFEMSVEPFAVVTDGSDPVGAQSKSIR